MKRTTIFVPEALERDLRLYARREGRPTAAVFREAVAEYLVNHGASSGLPSFAGAFDSGRRDTAERHEDLLFRALGPHGAEPTVRYTRPKRRARRRVR
jgi:hypothetical protein